MRALALALCLIATPAMAAEQFDLVCTAKKTSERYRVDLARGEWCFGECDFVQKVASVTSGLIVLSEHRPAFDGDKIAANRINRVSGEWEWYNFDTKLMVSMDHKGKCEPAPFSGMPAAKF